MNIRYFSFKHILLTLTCFVATLNSVTILTESLTCLKYINSRFISDSVLFLKLLTNLQHMNSFYMLRRNDYALWTEGVSPYPNSNL
jgi:hypothetical protein